MVLEGAVYINVCHNQQLLQSKSEPKKNVQTASFSYCIHFFALLRLRKGCSTA